MFHVCIFEGFTCIYGTPCLHPLTPTITLTLGVRPVRWSCFISSVPVVIVCLFNCCCNTLYIPLNHNNKCCSCSFVGFRLHFTLHTLSCWFESMKCSVRSLSMSFILILIPIFIHQPFHISAPIILTDDFHSYTFSFWLDACISTLMLAAPWFSVTIMWIVHVRTIVDECPGYKL